MIQLEFSFSAPEVTPELRHFRIPGPLPTITSPPEVAKITGWPVNHVYYLIYFCCIEAFKVRGSWRIFGPSVEAYAVRRSA